MTQEHCNLFSGQNPSRIAAQTCIFTVIDIMMEKYPHLKSHASVDLHVWSNECSVHFRSKYVFALTSPFPKSFNLSRYYNERHHGKGTMDGTGYCVKTSWWIEERLSKAQRSLKIVTRSSWKASIVIISRLNKWWKSQRVSKKHLIIQTCTFFKYIC